MFWISMFNHELRDREYDSAIISGLVVLALDTESGGWMPAVSYTPILAAVVTVLRALVVYRSWQRRQKEIQRRIVEEGITEEEADYTVEGTVEVCERWSRDS